MTNGKQVWKALQKAW